MKREKHLGAGVESGTHMRESAAGSEKLLGKPMPSKPGTPPWPKGGIKGSAGESKYKFK